MSDSNEERLKRIIKDIEDKDITDILDEDPEKAELAEMGARTKEIIKQIKKQDNPWGISPKGEMAKTLAISKMKTTHGMYARIPLVCRGENCPYADQCKLLPYGMAPEGEYCAEELAQIDLRAMGYSLDVGYDEASFTDKNLVSELIMLDIMLERCKALLAKDGTPVIDVAIGVDKDGNEIRQPSVSKAWDMYERVSKKRDATYQLLMMTRKDKSKKKDNNEETDITSVLRDVIDSADIEEIPQEG